MLHKMPSLELLRHELRRRVCERCRWRPAYSEALGPEAVRDCEQTCPAFLHLPDLRIAAVSTDPMLRSREQTLLHVIDRLPPTDPNGADPLKTYREEIVNVILDLVGRN